MKDIIGKFNFYLLSKKYLSVNTVLGYCNDIDQFADFCQSKKWSLHRITLPQVKEYLAFLVERELADATRYRKICSLKAFFKFYRKKAICEKLIIPQVERKLPRYLTKDKIDQLIFQLDQETGTFAFRNKIIILLLYTTGIRVSELTNIKVEHLLLRDGAFYVYGKRGKWRLVKMPRPMTALLNSYIEITRKKFIDECPIKTPYLFPIQYGSRVKPISRQSVLKILKDVGRRAGIQQTISPHQLRHSLATHLLEKGASLINLKEILGHERVATIEIYTHLDMSQRNPKYQKHPRANDEIWQKFTTSFKNDY